ncbi:CRISPR-associated helicase Cas3' [Infirmifilum sp.]|uniref:CRISPR-associated helicase Cas3' n=1 Tax=Infirmifilum sp. TaxID=2856575 RepID=UPI003D0C68C8
MRDLVDLIREMVTLWQSNSKGPVKRSIRVDEERLKLQADLAKRIYDGTDEGRLFLMTLPTGTGKTEAFLAPYFFQFVKGEFFAGRMFLVEPTHALLSQMRERVELYASIFSGVSVGEDHGDVDRATYLYTAPITLTTIDSFAYGFLAKRVHEWWKQGYRTGRYSLPVGFMGNAYIIFDEAHLIQDSVFLSPRVMGKIICNLVNSGAIVVFSSATLPKAVLDRLTRDCKDKVKELEVNVSVQRDINLTFVCEEKLTPEKVECKGGTLVIMNTVERAREMYYELKKKCGNVYLIHSLMTRRDRDNALKAVEKAFKGNDESSWPILIGTQSLEVGLDFPFKTLYTELSPIDSLIQRLGRVGREGVKADAFVYPVENYLPYAEDLIQRTQEILKNNPNYTSLLGSLDSVYSEKAISSLEERGDVFLLQVEEYMEALHLFSYPPREDVQIRPSTYVTIYVLKKDWLKPNNNLFSVRKKDLDEHSLRYSVSLLDDYSCERLRALLNDKEVFTYVKEDNESVYITNKFGKLEPCDMNSIYVIKDQVYDEAGLRIEEAKVTEGERKEKRARKTSSRRRGKKK